MNLIGKHTRRLSSLALSSWFCPPGATEFELLNRSAAFMVNSKKHGYGVVGSGHVVNPKRYWRRCYPDESWIGDIDVVKVRLELWSDENSKEEDHVQEDEDRLNSGGGGNTVLDAFEQHVVDCESEFGLPTAAKLRFFWPLALEQFVFAQEHDCCAAGHSDALDEAAASLSMENNQNLIVSLTTDLDASMATHPFDVCGLTIVDSGLPSELVRVARCHGKLKARSQSQLFVDTKDVRLEMGFCGGVVLVGESNRAIGMVEGIVNEPSSDATDILAFQKQVAGCASVVPTHVIEALFETE